MRGTQATFSSSRRVRGMSQYDETQVTIAQVAKDLGNLVSTFDIGDSTQFEQCVRQHGHPMQNLLIFVAHQRNPLRSTKRGSLLTRVESGHEHALVLDTFSQYCVIRRQAAPRSILPRVTEDVSVRVSRAVSIHLDRFGLRS